MNTEHCSRISRIILNR